jgi:hypothetical protein
MAGIMQCANDMSTNNPKEYKVNGVFHGRGDDTSGIWITKNAIVPLRNINLFVFYLSKGDSIIGFQPIKTDSVGRISFITPFERVGITFASSLYNYPDKVIDHINYFGWHIIVDFINQGIDSIFISDTLTSPW